MNKPWLDMKVSFFMNDVLWALRKTIRSVEIDSEACPFKTKNKLSEMVRRKDAILRYENDLMCSFAAGLKKLGVGVP